MPEINEWTDNRVQGNNGNNSLKATASLSDIGIGKINGDNEKKKGKHRWDSYVF